MRVAFRTDASIHIGTGHVMRCLTLADALRGRGAQCSFVTRRHEGHLLELIAQRGHQALALPALEEGSQSNLNGTAHAHWLGTDRASDTADTQRALSASIGRPPLDWLVVDHYALESRWEQALRPQARRIMVIDDLADRHHACDMLLDQNLGRHEGDYGGLLKGETITLIGPQYALLRPEFAVLRPQSLARRENTPRLRHLLISMGGVDKDNATGQVLDALKASALPADLRITVVMGPHAPWLAQVQALAEQLPWRTEVLAGVNHMEQLMALSDLAIGAAGSTSWERCCMGLPSVVLVLAENQRAGARALKEMGAAIALETGAQISQFLDSLQDAQCESRVLAEISHAAAAVTDGRGCDRVVDCMVRCTHA